MHKTTFSTQKRHKTAQTPNFSQKRHKVAYKRIILRKNVDLGAITSKKNQLFIHRHRRDWPDALTVQPPVAARKYNNLK